MEAELQARCLQASQETNAGGRRGTSSGSPARPRRCWGDAGDGGARQGIFFPAGPLRRRRQARRVWPMPAWPNRFFLKSFCSRYLVI